MYKPQSAYAGPLGMYQNIIRKRNNTDTDSYSLCLAVAILHDAHERLFT